MHDSGSREGHLTAIRQVISFVNAQSDNPFVLKGGTALSLCYGLDRFSEGIDFDASGASHAYGRFREAVHRFCKAEGYTYRIAKDTATMQRAYIDYGNASCPLKVEASYRRLEIPDSYVCIKGGIKVYTLDELARLKAVAYSGQDKIRDLYDVAFICTHHYDELDVSARDALRAALEYKDLERFDYIVRTQRDGLIDPDALETMFLESFDKLGLLSPRADNEPTPEDSSPEVSRGAVALEEEAHDAGRASEKLLCRRAGEHEFDDERQLRNALEHPSESQAKCRRDGKAPGLIPGGLPVSSAFAQDLSVDGHRFVRCLRRYRRQIHLAPCWQARRP